MFPYVILFLVRLVRLVCLQSIFLVGNDPPSVSVGLVATSRNLALRQWVGVAAQQHCGLGWPKWESWMLATESASTVILVRWFQSMAVPTKKRVLVLICVAVWHFNTPVAVSHIVLHYDGCVVICVLFWSHLLWLPRVGGWVGDGSEGLFFCPA